jgi:bacterioferritin
MAKQKVSAKMMELLNKAIARELQVAIQYMWQHVIAVGFDGAVVSPELKSIAITEMKHAEAIAERLNYLGGIPTTKPTPIELGAAAPDMVKLDIKAEEEAIEMYKGIVKLAAQEGDVTTKYLFEGILKDEEEHHDYFTTLLEK